MIHIESKAFNELAIWSRRQHFLILHYYAQGLHSDCIMIEGNGRLNFVYDSTHFNVVTHFPRGYGKRTKRKDILFIRSRQINSSSHLTKLKYT